MRLFYVSFCFFCTLLSFSESFKLLLFFILLLSIVFVSYKIVFLLKVVFLLFEVLDEQFDEDDSDDNGLKELFIIFQKYYLTFAEYVCFKK